MNKTLFRALFKRVLYSVIILFLLVTFVFILLRISPGDPAGRFVSPSLSMELAENVRESFGLNKTIAEQYFIFIKEIFSGNLGISFSYRQPVISVIAGFLSFTAVFALISFSLQIFFALLLSLFGAGRRGTYSDKFLSSTGLIVYALPPFLIGVMLIFFFSEALQIFPSSGIKSFETEGMGIFERISDYLKHLALPLITLTAGGTAVLYKYLRENMDEGFNSEYVLYLRSNGVAEKEIIREHILPNAVSPLISIAGIELGILLSGTLITEVIFGLPGMGRLTIQSILLRDYPLVTGCTLVSGGLIIISNFIADLVKIKLDKRLIGKGMLD